MRLRSLVTRSSVFAAALFASPFSSLAQTPVQAALRVTAQAVSSPVSLTFTWPSDSTATNFTVRRRSAGAAAWGAVMVIPGGGTATSWVDDTVVAGARYEYWFTKNGSPAARGFLASGVEASPIEDRGVLILLVDDTKAAALASRLVRLEQDLVGDGWRVLRHDVSPTESVPNVKALIQADVVANPGEVEAVFLLGHIPVPYSGQIAPDGHSNHRGAWPADVYYGDLDGVWTDSSVNNITASRVANHNVPGDGKFDQSSIPSNIELAVGRVDLSNMPAFGVSEEVLLQRYLDKDHDYRHKVFAVEQRAVIDDNFGWFSGEAFAASGWRNFASLVGPANTTTGDYFTTLNTPAGAGFAWSYGCGGGTYTSAGGIGNTAQFVTSTNRNVFTMLFGSFFGDWDSTDNFLRAPLCSGWTLTNVWAGRPHWSFYPMGIGETVGTASRLSQNDTSAGGFFTRFVHLALMGDPTLRQHIVAPPSSVSVTELQATAEVAWSPSTEVVAGYHVYRSATGSGEFVRLTGPAVTGTTFVDPAPLVGNATYMVRALRLETTPSGSYWNLSQAAFAEICLPQTASNVSYGSGCYTILDPSGSTVVVRAMNLSASPPPVSTSTNGTLVTYTLADVPAFVPGSGMRLGVTILSFTPDLAGTSLASVGMPGCSLYVGAFDVVIPFDTTSSMVTTDVQVPAGLSCGLEFFSTAIALIPPNSLPNGQNAYGAVTANGVASTIGEN